MNPPDQKAVEDAARLAQERGAAAAGVVREQVERARRAAARARPSPEPFVGGLIIARILRRLGT